MSTRVWIAGVLLSALAPSSAAAFSSDRPAALLTFPYVVVDQAQGLDTRLRVINTDAEPIDVACGLENTTAHCQSAPQQVCDTRNDCPVGDQCVSGLQVSRFAFRLAAAQPIAWQLSAGAPLPLPENGGPIPAAPANPMRGVLRCFAANPDGSPSARNALVGEAIVERAGTALLDVASYNAVGAAAHGETLNADGSLLLGGAGGEYDACPQTVRVNTLFDLATDPIALDRSLQTTLALTRCGADLSRPTPADTRTVLQFLVHNEFEQRLSTSTTFVGQLVSPISLMDTSSPERSMFAATVRGTLSGSITIEAIGGGIMGVALEKRAGSDPSEYSTAAYNLHSAGQRADADEVVLELRCPAQPAAGCRQARFNRLTMSDRKKRSLSWEWRRGELADANLLGDPLDDATLALCVYTGPSDQRAAMLVPSAASGWQLRRSGIAYVDRSGAHDGVLTVNLSPAPNGRGRVAARAGGANLAPLDLDGMTTLPVLVQLLNDRTPVCLESVFLAADVRRDRPHLFDARRVLPE